ncbi:MAG: hypothetical protein ACE5J5_03005 [Candidatus Hydrothermarchaeales archaeon]
MVNKLYNGFKLIIGGSFTTLGSMIFFFTGSLLNKLYPLLENPNNPSVAQDTAKYITSFKQAHSYSIILVIIGSIMGFHAIIKLFQADFEEASEKPIY